jgi:hypothetical protein
MHADPPTNACCSDKGYLTNSSLSSGRPMRFMVYSYEYMTAWMMPLYARRSRQLEGCPPERYHGLININISKHAGIQLGFVMAPRTSSFVLEIKAALCRFEFGSELYLWLQCLQADTPFRESCLVTLDPNWRQVLRPSSSISCCDTIRAALSCPERPASVEVVYQGPFRLCSLCSNALNVRESRGFIPPPASTSQFRNEGGDSRLW